MGYRYLLVDPRWVENIAKIFFESSNRRVAMRLEWTFQRIFELKQKYYFLTTRFVAKVHRQAKNKFCVKMLWHSHVHSVKKVQGNDHSKSSLKNIFKNLFDAKLAPLSSLKIQKRSRCSGRFASLWSVPV